MVLFQYCINGLIVVCEGMATYEDHHLISVLLLFVLVTIVRLVLPLKGSVNDLLAFHAACHFHDNFHPFEGEKMGGRGRVE